MHLQSLELLGFKSFADKTLLNFHEGVTAVVGPNGCGKSNVLDAVRWVLGEQSAKSLRGDEMADVIFNGSETRKPIGFAEVSLTFTDCAEELGIDWHDVRVTRRVYRDGNSEYLLNKTLCRLRDIQSLFADTGIASSAKRISPSARPRLRASANQKIWLAPKSKRTKTSWPSSATLWKRSMPELRAAAVNSSILRAKLVRIEIESNSIGSGPRN